MLAGMEQYMDLHQGGIAGPTVPMGCVWSPDQTTLTCTPATPLAAGTQYTIHVGAGMTDAQGGMMTMDGWTTMGGQWATGGMMGGTHAGQPMGMMGPGWKHGMSLRNAVHLHDGVTPPGRISRNTAPGSFPTNSRRPP